MQNIRGSELPELQVQYSEILQDAEGVSKGGRGPTAAGNHRALVKFLKKEVAAINGRASSGT
jgi:hypothetical protein